MLGDREWLLDHRFKVFEDNLSRAKAFASVAHSGEFRSEIPDIDLKRSAIIFTVGSFDEFCKGLFFDVLAGVIAGDIVPPRATTQSAPISVTRLFLDSRELSAGVQFEALALRELQRHVERDNYQSWDAVATQFSALGLGKLKHCFCSEPERVRFRDSLATLANCRHCAVHRVGIIDNNGLMSTDDDEVEQIIECLDLHHGNLRAGARAMFKSVRSCLSDRPNS